MNNKFKKIILFIILVLIIILVGLIIDSQRSNMFSDDGLVNQEAKKTVKVGVLADLSGDYVNLLRGVSRGAVLAVDYLEDNYDVEIELIMEDIQSCNTTATVNTMNKLTQVDQVDMVIGGSCSNTTLAAAPIANETKTIMISPASSAPSVSQAGPYVFRTYISDILRAKQAAELAYNLGYRNIAMIVDSNNDAAVEISKAMRDFFKEFGGNIVSSDKVGNSETDFRTILAKAKLDNPEVLYLAITNPKQIGLIAKQARELGLEAQIMVSYETAQDDIVVEIGGEAVEGLIYFATAGPPESERFNELAQIYRERYQEDVIPEYFTESYDATVLGVLAILGSDGRADSIRRQLFIISQNYQGVSGNVAFDENGDVSKNLSIKQIENGEFVLYKR